PLGVHVGGDHLGRARCSGDAHGETTDGTAPHDEHGTARNIRCQHRVKRVAHGVHHSAHRGGNAVERQHIGGGHGDVLRERAVAVHTDDAGVLADVAVAGAALETVSAHDMALGGDELPGPELRHPAAHRDDLAGELVSHHQG